MRDLKVDLVDLVDLALLCMLRLFRKAITLSNPVSWLFQAAWSPVSGSVSASVSLEDDVKESKALRRASQGLPKWLCQAGRRSKFRHDSCCFWKDKAFATSQ